MGFSVFLQSGPLFTFAHLDRDPEVVVGHGVVWQELNRRPKFRHCAIPLFPLHHLAAAGEVLLSSYARAGLRLRFRGL